MQTDKLMDELYRAPASYGRTDLTFDSWKTASRMYIVFIFICTISPFQFSFSSAMMYANITNIEWTSANLFSLTGDPFLNVLFFIPLGYFYGKRYLRFEPFIQKSSTFFIIMLIGLIVSFNVEVIQLFLATRITSFIDILANTAGAFIGSIVARIPLIDIGIALLK